MIRKPTDTQVVGLHLDGLSLKLAQIETIRDQVKLRRMEEFLLTEEGGTLKFRTEGEEKICREICDRFLTVASLDGKETLIRKLKMKLLKEKDIEAAFPFEAESALPFAAGDGLVDKIVVEKEGGQTHLTLVACKKSALENYLGEFHKLNLDPEIVATTPSALAAFVGRYAHLEDELIVVFIGENSSLSAIVKKGKLLSSHSINQGIAALKEADQIENFDAADLEKLKQEISWMILSEIKGIKNPNEAFLLSLGDGANLKGLDAILYKEIPSPRLELEAKEGMELNQSLLRKFAIAIGSALTALPNYQDPVNLRQGDLAYPAPWKRLKGTLTLFTTACFLLAFLLFICGQAYIGYREDELRQKYADLLAHMHKSYQVYEKEFIAARLPKGEEPPLTAPPLKELALVDLNERLQGLENEIRAQPDLYPLWPHTPRVSDLLTWLTHHPNMKGEEGAIKIESFSYQMIKRPEVSKKSDKYQIKVDLELLAPSPKMAREFHAALNSPNDFVDPKGEIKWSASRGKYQTTFYLKDKTLYPAVSKP